MKAIKLFILCCFTLVLPVFAQQATPPRYNKKLLADLDKLGVVIEPTGGILLRRYLEDHKGLGVNDDFTIEFRCKPLKARRWTKKTCQITRLEIPKKIDLKKLQEKLNKGKEGATSP